MEKPIVQVAIALLFYKNQILVGWREAKQHQGNKYEFPGGKVETGEKPVDACRREIQEEVGIDIVQWHFFDFIQHDYDDVIVQLHIFHGQVEQDQLDDIQKPWTWYQRQQLSALNFPKANDAIIQRLQWPQHIKISEDLSELANVQADHYFYLRTKPSAELVNAIEQLSLYQQQRLILNIDFWTYLNSNTQQHIAAIHLRQNQLEDVYAVHLKRQQAETHRCNLENNNVYQASPLKGMRCIAACHDSASLHLATKLGCEAVLLSPVLATASHQDQQGMGWEQFQTLAQRVDVPVFALGGLKPDDLAKAQQCGAYGVAGIRNF